MTILTLPQFWRRVKQFLCPCCWKKPVDSLIIIIIIIGNTELQQSQSSNQKKDETGKRKKEFWKAMEAVNCGMSQRQVAPASKVHGARYAII